MSDDCVLPWLLVICLLAFIWDAWAREKFRAVVCNGCGCTGPIENYEAAQQTAARAIELWNARSAA